MEEMMSDDEKVQKIQMLALSIVDAEKWIAQEEAMTSGFLAGLIAGRRRKDEAAQNKREASEKIADCTNRMIAILHTLPPDRQREVEHLFTQEGRRRPW